DHADAAAVRRLEDVVEHRGLAGAQEAPQDRDRYGLTRLHHPCLSTPAGRRQDSDCQNAAAYSSSRNPTSTIPSPTSNGRLINLPSAANASSAADSLVLARRVFQSPSRYETPEVLNSLATGLPDARKIAASCDFVGGCFTMSTSSCSTPCSSNQRRALRQVEHCG